MKDLKKMICDELEEIANKGELSAGDLETVYKLIVSKEKLLRIDELEDKLGYSYGDWSAEGSYGRSYNDGESYARRGRMGRRYRSGRYSMDGGKEAIIHRINEMMDTEDLDSSDRAILKKAVDSLRR